MSRVIVFGLDGRSVGEFTAIVERGWQIAGSPSTSGGGQASMAIGDDVAANAWLQFGRLVLIEHPTLPPWAGVIDTPWTPISPVQLTVYNAEYLLSLRSPLTAQTLSGTPGDIAGQLINQANAQEDLFMQLGDTATAGSDSRQEPFDQRSFWEQLSAFAKKAGIEITLRPVREQDNRLSVYVDLAARAGIDTGFQLKDGGPGANMILTGAKVDGKIRNQLYGIGKESTQASRKAVGPLRDEASISLYRLRSSVDQSEAPDETTLIQNTQVALDYQAWPRLQLTVDAADVGDTFKNLRLGNSVLLHAANLRLPGGVSGWSGAARILAMVYRESRNVVSMALEAPLFQGAL